MRVHHFFANIGLTFVLFFLLLSPVLISVGLIGFGSQKQVLGVSVGNISYSYLVDVDVKNQKRDFKNIEVKYQRIPSGRAFYPKILEVVNSSDNLTEAKLFDVYHLRADVFFATNDQNTGPKSYFLASGERVFVNLTANEGDLIDTLDFSLESW